MKKIIQQQKLLKRIAKTAKQYSTQVELVNGMYQSGASRHECMILELLLVNKSYNSIKEILLFTEDSFIKLCDDLYKSLKTHKKSTQISFG